MEQRPRNTNGTFKKGQPSPAGARRKAGTANKITRDIREGAIAGFARHGSNGRGEGGFAGFCYFLAKKHPKTAARIVEKLLPLQVHGSGFAATIGAINLVAVPSDRFLTPEDLARMRDGEPMQIIEHAPQLDQRQADDDNIDAPTNDDAA